MLALGFSGLFTTHKEATVAGINCFTTLVAAYTAFTAKKATAATPDKALIRALEKDRQTNSETISTVLKSMERSQRMLERQLDAMTQLLREQIE